MSALRKKIENRFESLAITVCRRPWVVLAIAFAFIAVLALQLPKLTMDTSSEGMFHENDPILKSYYEFREQFGRDEMVVIAIQPKNIFALSFLKKLEKLHYALEENVAHLYDITSLINVRNTYGVKGGIVVDDLLRRMPDSSAVAMKNFKINVLSHPLYLNRFISKDGKITAIVIETNNYSSLMAKGEKQDFFKAQTDIGINEEQKYLTEKENSKAVKSVKKIISKFRSDDFKIFLAGSPVARDTFTRAMKMDFKKFIGISIIIIAVCLGVMFRRVSGVFLPLIIVILSLVSTLGFIGLMGINVSMPTLILPSLLLVIGVGDCVHLLAIFYEKLKETNEKTGSIVHALRHSGLPIVITSLTTMAGLLSFSFAEVAPISHLGIYSSIGIFLAMLYSLVLLPAFLSILPIKLTQETHGHDINLDNVLNYIADFSIKHTKSIVYGGIIIIIGFSIGLTQFHFSHDQLSWLPKSSPVRISTLKIDKELNGTVTAEVIVDTGRENGLYDLSVLKNLEHLTKEIGQLENGKIFAGKIISVVDILKEINQALHQNNSEHYIIPENQKLIPQEFLLFENSGSDDLEDVIDSSFRIARFTIKTPWADAYQYVPFLKEIEERFSNTFGTTAKVTVTGMMALYNGAFLAAIQSASTSYAFAFVIISVIIIFLVGKLRMGVICLIPNFAPIIITMGLMGWLGISLDMFSMMVGSVAIGIVVDDTIHFIYNFKRYYQQSANIPLAIRQTINTTGRAMLITSVVLTLGFFIYLFAVMNNLFYFGLLTGITVLLALLADFVFLPALINFFPSVTKTIK